MVEHVAYRLLSSATTGCACASFLCLFISVTTDHWLYTAERKHEANGSIPAVYDHYYSGLWKKCIEQEDSRTSCNYINYFATVDRDGLGATESILLSLRRAAVFPVVSLIILFAGQTLCLLLQWRHGRPSLTTVFGFLYVIGGLCMFVGIIIYIGAITEEAGNQPKSMDDPKFLYSYGPSFALIFTSFVGSEITGVLAVHLYVARRRLRHTSRRTAMIGQVGEMENGAVNDGCGSGSGELAYGRRNGASLMSKIFAAVFPANTSPTKNISKFTTAIATASADDRTVNIVTATSCGGGRNQKNRRRRSSLALADQQLLSRADSDRYLGGGTVGVSRRGSAVFDHEEDLISVLRGASLPRVTANKQRPDAERQPTLQLTSTVTNITQPNNNSNNYGRSTSSYSVATSSQQQQQPQHRQHQQLTQCHPSLVTSARSITNSPGTASVNYRYYTSEPDDRRIPLRSVGVRSPSMNYPYCYSTMTSLPPTSASLHDGRLYDMASGYGLVSRAWSIDGFDQGIRRITNV